jgi:HK97 family phage prohead protease
MDGSSELERRLIGEVPGLEVKEDQNGRTVIRGWAAVFESESQDLGGFVEIVERGAFDDVMRSNPDVFGKYNHERVIGRTTSGTMRLFVDERGLRYEIDPPKSAADVVELISRGDVRGSSFAFRSSPKDESWSKDVNGRMIRRIKRFSFLGDAGPVDTPAYLATETYVSKRALEMANEQRADIPVVEDSSRAVPQPEAGEDAAVEAADEARAATVMHAPGDFVAWDGGVGGVGRVEHVMAEGQLGEYSEEPMEATPDDPAVLIRLWESDDGQWEESDFFVAKRMSELSAHADVADVAEDDERAVSLKPTAGMAAAAKRGLRLHEEGKSGDGLKPETVARANRLARRDEMNSDWVREMNAWFARHESASKSPGWDTPGEEKPGFVAWLLWGGTPAKNFAARKVKQLEAESARASEAAVDTTDYIGKAAALKAAILSTPLHGIRHAR